MRPVSEGLQLHALSASNTAQQQSTDLFTTWSCRLTDSPMQAGATEVIVSIGHRAAQGISRKLRIVEVSLIPEVVAQRILPEDPRGI